MLLSRSGTHIVCSVGILELMGISRSPGTTPLCFFQLKKNEKQNKHSHTMSSKFDQFKFPVQRPQPAPASKMDVELKRG